MMEKAVSKYLHHAGRLARNRLADGPLLVFLELTKRCNLRCKSCDIWKIPAKITTDELSTLEVKRLIDQTSNTTMLYHLIGGEIFLRKDIIQIVKYIKNYACNVGITTNGVLLTPQKIDELNQTGLSFIRFSIDGPEDCHDEQRGIKSYKKILKNLKHALTLDMHIGINTIINKTTIKMLPEFIDEMNIYGVQDIQLTPMHEMYPINFFTKKKEKLLLNKDDIPQLLEVCKLIDRHPTIKTKRKYIESYINILQGNTPTLKCRAGSVEIDIDAKGNVHACYGLSKRVGNIRQDSFEKIWNSTEFKEAREKVHRCRHCWDNCHVETAEKFDIKHILRFGVQDLEEVYKSIGKR